MPFNILGFTDVNGQKCACLRYNAEEKAKSV